MSFLSLTTTLQSSFNHSSLKQKAAGAQRGSVTCQRTRAQERDAVWVGVHCFPEGSAGKESACNTGDPGSIPGLGGSPGEGRGYPLQYSGLENFMGCIVYWIAKSWTRLSDFRRRQWHPTPVLLPGKSHEWRSLESCSPWGR